MTGAVSLRDKDCLMSNESLCCAVYLKHAREKQLNKDKIYLNKNDPKKLFVFSVNKLND